MPSYPEANPATLFGNPPPPTRNYEERSAVDVQALQEQVLELLEIVERHQNRIDVHGERLRELKADIDRVKNGVKPLRSDKFAQMRDEIMHWVVTMPPGVWFGYRAIIDNMGIEDARSHSYQQQLENLMHEGRLERKRGGQNVERGMKGGGTYLYRVPMDPVNTDG